MKTIQIELGERFSDKQDPFTYKLHSYLLNSPTYDLELISPYGYDRKPEYQIKLCNLEKYSFINMIISIALSLIKNDGDIEDWEMWLEDLQNILEERKKRVQRRKS